MKAFYKFNWKIVLYKTVSTVFVISLFVCMISCSQVKEYQENLLQFLNREKEADKAVATVEAFFNALISGDIEVAYSYIYIYKDIYDGIEDKVEYPGFKDIESSTMEELQPDYLPDVVQSSGSVYTLDDFKAEIFNMTEIIKCEINWVEIKNNVAIVGVDIIDTYDGEEKIYKDIEVSLIRDKNEEWKINFWG